MRSKVVWVSGRPLPPTFLSRREQCRSRSSILSQIFSLSTPRYKIETRHSGTRSVNWNNSELKSRCLTLIIAKVSRWHSQSTLLCLENHVLGRVITSNNHMTTRVSSDSPSLIHRKTYIHHKSITTLSRREEGRTVHKRLMSSRISSTGTTTLNFRYTYTSSTSKISEDF